MSIDLNFEKENESLVSFPYVNKMPLIFYIESLAHYTLKFTHFYKFLE